MSLSLGGMLFRGCPQTTPNLSLTEYANFPVSFAGLDVKLSERAVNNCCVVVQPASSEYKITFLVLCVHSTYHI